jgi:hypothetical protein
MRVTGEQVHRPNRFVGEILLDIGEASDGLARDEVAFVGELDVTQQRHAVAHGASNLAGLVEGRELLLQSQRRVESEHRSLSAGDENGVEALDIQLPNRPGQPVEVEIAGLEITIATRLGLLGLTGLAFFRPMARSCRN